MSVKQSENTLLISLDLPIICKAQNITIVFFCHNLLILPLKKKKKKPLPGMRL